MRNSTQEFEQSIKSNTTTTTTTTSISRPTQQQPNQNNNIKIGKKRDFILYNENKSTNVESLDIAPQRKRFKSKSIKKRNNNYKYRNTNINSNKANQTNNLNYNTINNTLNNLNNYKYSLQKPILNLPQTNQENQENIESAQSQSLNNTHNRNSKKKNIGKVQLKRWKEAQLSSRRRTAWVNQNIYNYILQHKKTTCPWTKQMKKKFNSKVGRELFTAYFQCLLPACHGAMVVWDAKGHVIQHFKNKHHKKFLGQITKVLEDQFDKEQKKKVKYCKNVQKHTKRKRLLNNLTLNIDTEPETSSSEHSDESTADIEILSSQPNHNKNIYSMSTQKNNIINKILQKQSIISQQKLETLTYQLLSQLYSILLLDLEIEKNQLIYCQFLLHLQNLFPANVCEINNNNNNNKSIITQQKQFCANIYKYNQSHYQSDENNSNSKHELGEITLTPIKSDNNHSNDNMDMADIDKLIEEQRQCADLRKFNVLNDSESCKKEYNITEDHLVNIQNIHPFNTTLRQDQFDNESRENMYLPPTIKTTRSRRKQHFQQKNISQNNNNTNTNNNNTNTNNNFDNNNTTIDFDAVNFVMDNSALDIELSPSPPSILSNENNKNKLKRKSEIEEFLENEKVKLKVNNNKYNKKANQMQQQWGEFAFELPKNVNISEINIAIPELSTGDTTQSEDDREINTSNMQMKFETAQFEREKILNIKKNRIINNFSNDALQNLKKNDFQKFSYITIYIYIYISLV